MGVALAYIQKPVAVRDRDREWDTLATFLAHPDPHLRIGVVAGRRRVGKSYLLRALVEAAGGLFVSAVAEEDAPLARRRLAEAVARYAGVGTDLLAVTAGWEELLSTAIELVVRRDGPSGLLVIDELPYWLTHSPEIEGILQLLYDRSRAGDGAAGGRIVLCGSALSVMNLLLSGRRALRGRAAVDLRLEPFDLPTSAQHWGIAEPATALHLYATLGGSAGYRDLSPVAPPQRLADFDDWICRSVLSPGQALFSRNESEYLLREDPRFTGSALHYGILRAVAGGASSPAQIGALLERDRTVLGRPLAALVEAGYLRYDHDPLWKRRPVITLADQIVRFHNLVTVPQHDLVETGRAGPAWQNARPTFQARILGPQFEDCARGWLRRNGPDHIGLEIGSVAAGVVHDGSQRIRHELDAVALLGDRITLVGEAKATIAPVGRAELERLDRIVGILTAQKRDATGAVRALFSLHGFRADLVRLASERADVLLVDLSSLVGGAAPAVAPAATD